MSLWEALLVTAAAGIGGTGAGGALACAFRRDESGRGSSLLLSFAAGVMVSVVCFGLLTEAAAPPGRPGLPAPASRRCRTLPAGRVSGAVQAASLST